MDRVERIIRVTDPPRPPERGPDLNPIGVAFWVVIPAAGVVAIAIYITVLIGHWLGARI